MMLRRFHSCRKGSAAAEMALVLPLMVLILFTSLEAGNYFYAQHQVVKGLRDGARFAARHSFDEINCRSGGYIDSALAANVKTLARTGKLSGGTTRVKGWVDGDITVTVTCSTTTQATTGIYSSSESAPQVNVATSLSYDSLFNGLGVITNSFTLNAEQQATVMGI
ncbi:MAG TPA: pilus assembly protein TadE [Erythrobacter sp.]|nr:pilus assembly protein TadE [Erythrobacter sp.]